jgi:hypothetical protein
MRGNIILNALAYPNSARVLEGDCINIYDCYRRRCCHGTNILCKSLTSRQSLTRSAVNEGKFRAIHVGGLPKFAWFHRRAEYRALIETDTKALIDRLGEQAYSEARERQHFPPFDEDANRTEHHWERAKEAIRRMEAGAKSASTLPAVPRQLFTRSCRSLGIADRRQWAVGMSQRASSRPRIAAGHFREFPISAYRAAGLVRQNARQATPECGTRCGTAFYGFS